MRTWLRGKVTLLFIVCAVLIAVPGAAALAQDTSTPAAPTIQSDKADYAPGEQVTLSGANWAAGETVHIRVNDDAGKELRSYFASPMGYILIGLFALLFGAVGRGWPRRRTCKAAADRADRAGTRQSPAATTRARPSSSTTRRCGRTPSS